MVMSVDDVHRARYKGNDLYNIDLGGTEEGYAAGGTTMKAGRFFSDQESAHHMPIAVIGEDVGRQLFENADRFLEGSLVGFPCGLLIGFGHLHNRSAAQTSDASRAGKLSDILTLRFRLSIQPFGELRHVQRAVF